MSCENLASEEDLELVSPVADAGHSAVPGLCAHPNPTSHGQAQNMLTGSIPSTDTTALTAEVKVIP